MKSYDCVGPDSEIECWEADPEGSDSFVGDCLAETVSDTAILSDSLFVSVLLL